MTDGEADLIARMRAEAASPETLFVVIRGRNAIFRDDIIGKTDNELLAAIREKIEKPKT